MICSKSYLKWSKNGNFCEQKFWVVSFGQLYLPWRLHEVSVEGQILNIHTKGTNSYFLPLPFSQDERVMNHKMKVRGRQRIFRFLDPLSFGSRISNQVLVWGAYAFSIVNSMLWGGSISIFIKIGQKHCL